MGCCGKRSVNEAKLRKTLKPKEAVRVDGDAAGAAGRQLSLVCSHAQVLAHTCGAARAPSPWGGQPGPLAPSQLTGRQRGTLCWVVARVLTPLLTCPAPPRQLRESLLHAAAAADSDDTVAALVEAGNEVDPRDAFNQTPLCVPRALGLVR